MILECVYSETSCASAGGVGRQSLRAAEHNASPEVDQVTLTWDGPRRILRRLRLIDEITGQRVPMRPGASYTFPTDGAPRVFSCRLRGRRIGSFRE